MNTNLRAMIDDALDGAYAQEQSYGYADYSDVPSLDNASEDAVKIASALNHVASNLQFIGTTEEKLAELELFSEMLKEASEESTAVAATEEAAEAAGKGLGESWEALKTKSVPDVWKNMSGTSKAIAGGGAALLGLGALYGGYKALGGGSEKRSALDEARSRAFAKVAQRYDIPVDELENMTKEARLKAFRRLKRLARKARVQAAHSGDDLTSTPAFKKIEEKVEKQLKPISSSASGADEAQGFFQKNRRLLLGAGGVTAAGLTGYGVYKGTKDRTKTASYMSKVAEDRINPARIRAGASDPFSGFDIRSHGGGGSQFNPVALRAQQVRSRINSDMHTHVNNVGGGYNLDHYLNRFNK